MPNKSISDLTGTAPRGPTGESDIPRNVIDSPCCRRKGEEGQLIGLNSGSGPGAISWQVSGPGVTNPVAQAISGPVPSLWDAALAPSGWIQPNVGNCIDHPTGTFTYSVGINVPSCDIPTRVTLSGEAAGDDEVQVDLDATLIGQTPLVADPSVSVAAGQRCWGFRAARILSFTHVLPPGLHVLRFEVLNSSVSPHGLLVRAAIRTTCPA